MNDTKLMAMRQMRNQIGYAVPGLWLEKLLSLEPYQPTACIGLLKVGKFRSTFRKSLREQLERWLNDLSGYPKPFSWKQWKHLCRYQFRNRNNGYN